MKRYLSIGVVLIAVASASWVFIQGDFVTPDDLEPAVVKFDLTEIGLGQLEQGKPKTATFTFINTGNNPLLISNAEASCGCITPEWPKNPIKPGKNGEIKITYDAKYLGRFKKTVKLFCNTGGGIDEVIIKGEVSSGD